MQRLTTILRRARSLVSTNVTDHFNDQQRLNQEMAKTHPDAQDVVDIGKKDSEESKQKLPDCSRRGTPRAEGARGHFPRRQRGEFCHVDGRVGAPGGRSRH